MSSRQPYLETLHDEIFRKKRRYAIFASRVFEDLLGNATGLAQYGIGVKCGKQCFTTLTKKDGTSTSTIFRCMKIFISYKGKQQDAMIAHTYPIQFGGDIMRQYGDFCHKNY